MKKLSLLLALAVLIPALAVAQTEAENHPVTIGVQSLTISPEARGASMGDLGAATSADVNSQFWNPAKYVFTESNAGLSFSFTPWLRRLVDDINLTYLSGYYKISDRSAISSSLRYFSLGEVPLTDWQNNPQGTAFPNEFAFDAGYSQKLSDNFSAATALRLIYSDLSNGRNLTGGSETYAGVAVAADVALFYSNPIPLATGDAKLNLGMNISNIGSKISYDEGASSSFIPANMRIGASFEYPIDDYQRISFSADANKLLAPTTDYAKTAENIDYYNDMTSLQGILSSFGDAPGGFAEELREIYWSIGAEYVYNNQFAIRAGYYNEDQFKGNRKYFTAGAGFKLNVFQLDAAYVVSVSQTNPLDGTLRFSLSFDLFGLQNLMR
ncbi:MAG: type IX secretion system outer membrane channel protein PorV [Paludibacter sp.]|nr:type IX secretion system outer membrane channel protein PorV [Paludibacter sp.]